MADMIETAGGRSVKEWIGSSPDAKVPPRVQLRIFERYGGRCYLTGQKINPGDKWELEHISALANGGQHRERNLAPALVEPHKIKTAADRKIKAKRDRAKKKRYGIVKTRNPLPGSKASRFKRCMDGTVIDRRTGLPVGQRGNDQ